MILRGVPWSQYESLIASRGDGEVPRIAYADGMLEITRPSFDHEAIKTSIARLLEAWALLTRTRLLGVSPWTLRRADIEKGLEPDECYIVGRVSWRPDRPDLAIEVVWTHGGMDKLGIYSALGVPEVWVWADGLIAVHAMEGDRYRAVAESRVLPGVPVALLAELAQNLDQMDAIERLRGILES